MLSVEYEDRLTIATPEGVELDLTLAGLGSRSIAAAFDLALQAVILLGLALATGLLSGALQVAVMAAVGFVVVFGYDVAFEVLAAGRTPGKRLTGLRVVRDGGWPIRFMPSAVRNLLRIIDFMPGLYGLGIVVVFATPRNQRLGDLAAGTLVVRERHGGRRLAPAPAPLPPPSERSAGWDLSAVTAADVATIREFLARRPAMDPAAADRLAHDLAARLRPRVAGVGAAQLAAGEFLEEIARRKLAREATVDSSWS